MIRLSLTSNTVSRDLERRIKAVKNTTPLLRAAGEVVAQMAKGAFNEPSLRPLSWARKADGSEATLRKNNVLARSPRVTSATPKNAIVGSDREYAAIHQLGGKSRPMPARPYFPFLRKKPTHLAVKAVREALARKLGMR
jgi:phage gpG-like protein